MKKVLLSILLTLLPLLAIAETVEFNGIWYNIISKAHEAEVTQNPSGERYFGNVDIPPFVTYNKVEYSVTSIGDAAFYDCSGLTSVTIPNSVTSIGDWAFWDCKCLRTITSEINTPFAIGNIISSDYYSQTILIVPKNTKEVYQATDGWNKFTNIVEVGEGGVVGQTFNSDNLNYQIGENRTVSVVSGYNIEKFTIPNQVTYKSEFSYKLYLKFLCDRFGVGGAAYLGGGRLLA